MHGARETWVGDIIPAPRELTVWGWGVRGGEGDAARGQKCL